jgi:hypothetical protein
MYVLVVSFAEKIYGTSKYLCPYTSEATVIGSRHSAYKVSAQVSLGWRLIKEV